MTRGMKLKLCRNVHNISLYKNCVFLLPLLMYFRCYNKFPLAYNGKSESRPLWQHTADILTKVFLKCSLSSLPNVSFLANPRNLISCRKAKFAKKNIPKSSQKPLGRCIWNFAELFITLAWIASTKNMFFIAVAHVLSLLRQLKSFHSPIIGKKKIGIYCSFIADIWQSFSEHIILVLNFQFDWLIWKKKKVFRSYIVGKAETLQKCS